MAFESLRFKRYDASPASQPADQQVTDEVIAYINSHKKEFGLTSSSNVTPQFSLRNISFIGDSLDQAELGTILEARLAELGINCAPETVSDLVNWLLFNRLGSGSDDRLESIGTEIIRKARKLTGLPRSPSTQKASLRVRE